MGFQGHSPSRLVSGRCKTPFFAFFFALFALFPLGIQAQSPNIPLVLPSGMAFDAAGNLYLAESGNHLVRKLTPSGTLTIAAGTGTQGFSGDGGPATSALLDSPAAVALDASGNLYLADTHNRRIRRVDAVTGIISTVATSRLPVALAFTPAGTLVFADAALHQIFAVNSGNLTVIAGNGTQGFSGDGGPATQAAIDSPYGLACDTSGNLYLADTHNHRLRRVDAATGIISTVAGTGAPGFSGDGTAASASQLSLPRGVTLDSAGNLYLADSRNQRVRRIDAITGAIATIAGNGMQAFLGDGSPAANAALDSPKAVAISGSGLSTVADSANGRVRQVAASTAIQTIAGLGAIAPTPVTPQLATTAVLTATNAQTLTAAVDAASGTPTGTVSLIDGTTPIASAALTNGTAAFATSILSTGSHTLTASYGGSSAYLPSVSQPIIVTNGGTAPADFSLAANAVVSSTVVAGSTATFSFTVTPANAPLPSALTLALTGLPSGASASFNPASLPPSAGPSTFTLSVTTPASARLTRPFEHNWCWPALAGMVFAIPLAARRRRNLALAGVLLLAGCGARVNSASGGSGPVTYNLTVTASYTASSGTTVTHSVSVALTVD